MVKDLYYEVLSYECVDWGDGLFHAIMVTSSLAVLTEGESYNGSWTIFSIIINYFSLLSLKIVWILSKKICAL